MSALVRISRSYEPLGLRVEKSISFLCTLHLPCTVLAFRNILHLIAPIIPTIPTTKLECYLCVVLQLNLLFFLFCDFIPRFPVEIAIIAVFYNIVVPPVLRIAGLL